MRQHGWISHKQKNQTQRAHTVRFDFIWISRTGWAKVQWRFRIEVNWKGWWGLARRGYMEFSMCWKCSVFQSERQLRGCIIGKSFSSCTHKMVQSYTHTLSQCQCLDLRVYCSYIRCHLWGKLGERSTRPCWTTYTTSWDSIVISKEKVKKNS